MRSRFVLFFMCLVLTGSCLVSCQKEFTCEDCENDPQVTDTNRPPVACAGEDLEIVLPANSTTLDGRCSSDPDNDIVGYTWTKLSGPATSTITSANEAETEVKDLSEGIYRFQLKVTDAAGLYSFDTVEVIVSESLFSSEVDIYVTGASKEFDAVYWKNGQIVHLPSGLVDAYARAITIVGSDVYVAGEEIDFSRDESQSKYWKNGKEVFLETSNNSGSYSIAVDGSDVYVAGWLVRQMVEVAVYWKNEELVPLTDGTVEAVATDIKIHNGVVHAVGWEGAEAKYWRNGQSYSLGPGKALSLVIDGDDVHIVGIEWNQSGSRAVYWKNGSPGMLSQQLKYGVAQSVAVAGGHVYIGGYESNHQDLSQHDNTLVAKYWKDGNSVPLPGSGVVTSIAIHNSDVYVGGIVNGSNVRVWKNGKAFNHPGVSITDMIVVPR